ncbi:MAG: hypothetical protein Q9201_003880 [Fulgogasparrea decipioides]
MADTDAFTLVNEASQHKVFDDYEELSSGHLTDEQTYLTAVFRRQYPELAVTCTSVRNPPLLAFAGAGHATAELDITDESINRIRGYAPGNPRYGYTEGIVESRYFAKYKYKWGNEFFIVYIITFGYFSAWQFILKEPGENETTLSNPKAVDALIMACGRWYYPVDNDFIYVYDGYWSASKALWQQVQKASWKDVILNEEMKKTLVDLMTKFFDSEDIYKSLGVPWKRGVIFHGPAGNGKTISIKALMHSLSTISGTLGKEIPALYVKSAPRTFDIRSIFIQARAMAPCMLILEDIDTIVTPASRSYFFNEVDGLENNDGIFMVASTNHLDQLDPGLSSRPSRFDRKYLFPLPQEHERTLYCEYWRNKLKSKPTIKFPRKLCPAIAGITKDFSFAYLQELFIATLLAIAGHRSEHDDELHRRSGSDGEDDDDGGDLDHYELWREIKKQVKALRDDMGNQAVDASATEFPEANDAVNDLAADESHRPGKHPQQRALAFRPKAPAFPNSGSGVQPGMGFSKPGPVRFDRDGQPAVDTLVGKAGGLREVPLFSSDGTLMPNHSLPFL